MKAIVCDKCGAVVLLEDGPISSPKGINHVDGAALPSGGIDLCDKCTAELVAAVRGAEGDGE